MHAEIFVKWHASDDHASGTNVPDHGDGGQSAGGKRLVGVNDVLVAGDEDAKDAVAEQGRSGQRGPDADVRVCGPTHPEQTDGNGERAAQHGEPEAKFGRETVATLFLDFLEVAFRPFVDERHEGRSTTQPDDDAEETETSQTLGQAVSLEWRD